MRTKSSLGARPVAEVAQDEGADMTAQEVSVHGSQHAEANGKSKGEDSRHTKDIGYCSLFEVEEGINLSR